MKCEYAEANDKMTQITCQTRENVQMARFRVQCDKM